MSKKKKKNKSSKSRQSNQTRLTKGRSKDVLFGTLEQAVLLEYGLGKEIPELCEKYSLTRREVSGVINRYKQIREISEFGENEKELFLKLKKDLIDVRESEIEMQLIFDFLREGHSPPEDLSDREAVIDYMKETMGDSFKPSPSSDELFNLLGLEEEMNTSK